MTQDLDALRRRLKGGASGLELLRAAGAKDINEIGGLVRTERGDVRVDVLEARHDDLDRDFTDATDRLEAMAHQWALETATADLVMTEFEKADPQLVDDVAAHARWKFRTNVLRTRRIIRDLGQTAVDAELIDGAVDFLEGLLQSG